MMRKMMAVLVCALPAFALAAERTMWSTGMDAIPAPHASNLDRVNFDTGFESPFTLGAINLQQGWTTFAANASAPVIANENPKSGSQHLRVVKGPGATSSFNGAFSPDLGDFVNEASTFSVDVFINDLDFDGADTQIVGQAPSQALLSYRINFQFDGDILILDDADGPGPGTTLSFIDTNVNWTPGVYKNFKVDFDPLADSLKYYYDNTLIYTGSVGVFAGTAVEQVILFGDNFHTDATDRTDWDNVSLSPIPEPATLALLALGALLRRR